jgi:hypothetical protein
MVILRLREGALTGLSLYLAKAVTIGRKTAEWRAALRSSQPCPEELTSLRSRRDKEFQSNRRKVGKAVYSPRHLKERYVLQKYNRPFDRSSWIKGRQQPVT